METFVPIMPTNNIQMSSNMFGTGAMCEQVFLSVLRRQSSSISVASDRPHFRIDFVVREGAPSTPGQFVFAP